jgi:hypothetical protein
MGLLNTGGMVIRNVKSVGKALRSGTTAYELLPGVLNVDTDNPAWNDVDKKYRKVEDVQKYNELLRTKSILNKRPLYCGTIQTSIACTPKLAEALAIAESEKKALEELNKEELFEKDESGKLTNKLKADIKNDDWLNYNKLVAVMSLLQKHYESGVKMVHFVQPWNIDQLIHYVNLAFSEKDAKEIYIDGKLEAQALWGDSLKMVVMICAMFCIAIVLLVMFLT